MNYIIFDLEATCVKDHDPDFRNEIIEIGAICLDEEANYIRASNEFIKPKINPILSDFCKELTTISQEQVDISRTFPHVINDFREWIGNEYLLCSWGDYDRKQLMKDCILHGIEYDWVQDHFNIKNDFARIFNMKPCGMKKALQIAEIPLEGTHHRGIDDAINISKIFLKYFREWRFE